MTIEQASSGGKAVLVYTCGALGVLCVAAALLLYAVSSVTDASGAKSQGALITCIAGAAASFMGAAVVEGMLP